MTRWFLGAACLAAAGLIGGQAAQANAVRVEIKDPQGRSFGDAMVIDSRRGLLIQVNVDGLEPGAHGFHVHTVGKCEGPAFTSAGGHFNPKGTSHGFLAPMGHHAGDLPNLVAGPTGRAVGHFYLHGTTLADLQDKDGSSLVVHATADDYRTDPAGGSGDRLGCAVIAAPK